MPDNPHKVHFVYLVPKDKTNNAETAINRTALHLQAWYRWQMGNEKTFTLCNPVVEVYATEHDAIWYPENENGASYSDYYWNNVLADADAYAGAGFYQEFDDWVVFVDSNPGIGQYIGGTSGGYISGIAVLSGNDLRGIRGVHPVFSRCRTLGGVGHELGHTFGLEHPDPPTGHEYGHGIMGSGFAGYSDAHLTDADKASLNGNPFFERRRAIFPPDLCPFDAARRRPYPIRRPTQALT